MAVTSKNKKQQWDDSGKESFKSTSADFERLVKLMAEPGFHQAQGGAMTFYDNPQNSFFSGKYKREGFQNGYNQAKKKAMEAVAGAASAAALEAKPDPNDMFANAAMAGPVSAKRSVSPTNSESLVEGPLDLETGDYLELPHNCKSYKPMYLAQCFKGSNQTHGISITVATTSGVVPYPTGNPDDSDDDGGDDDLDLSGVEGTVEDGPEGEPIFLVKERQTRGVWDKTLKQRNLKSYPNHSKDDWNRGLVAFENDVAGYQKKDGDPLYSVCQFRLPFKVLKNIKQTDILIQFDEDDGNCTITFHLWHADQSGRTAAGLTKVARYSKYAKSKK